MPITHLHCTTLSTFGANDWLVTIHTKYYSIHEKLSVCQEVSRVSKCHSVLGNHKEGFSCRTDSDIVMSWFFCSQDFMELSLCEDTNNVAGYFVDRGLKKYSILVSRNKSCSHSLIFFSLTKTYQLQSSQIDPYFW